MDSGLFWKCSGNKGNKVSKNMLTLDSKTIYLFANLGAKKTHEFIEKTSI